MPMSTEDTAPNLSNICSFPTEVKHCVLMLIAGNAPVKEMQLFSSEVMKAAEISFL